MTLVGVVVVVVVFVLLVVLAAAGLAGEHVVHADVVDDSQSEAVGAGLGINALVEDDRDRADRVGRRDGREGLGELGRTPVQPDPATDGAVGRRRRRLLHRRRGRA